MSDSTHAKTRPYAPYADLHDRETELLDATDSELAIPRERKFGRYELVMEMARGGMATLFLARLRGPVSFERLVALKRIHEQLADEKQFTQMFLDEARITASIHHPNVASVYDMGQVDRSYYLAMEYVHGQNLSEVLRASSRTGLGFDYNHALRVVADAAAGLHAAHELTSGDGTPLGVVHRDVSPQNLLISYDGHVKVVDFGIAYAAERISSTATGTLKGKVTYLSPEQIMGATVDRRADVFALGIVLWESVLVRRLFHADSAAASMMRIRDGVVPPPRSLLPELPESVERIILKALAPEPAQRYQSMAELEADINHDLVQRDQVVSHAQLAQMMDQRFAQQRRVKDEQIQQALQAPHAQPLLSATVDAPTESLSTALQFSDLVGTKPPFRTPLYLAGGIAVVGLLVLGILLWARTTGDRGEAPLSQAKALSARADGGAQVRPMVRTLPMPRPRAAPIRVSLEIRPARAKPVVLFRDRKYRGSSVLIEVPRVERHEYLLVSAQGYHPEQLKVDLRQDTIHRLKLRPLKRPPPMRRRVFRRTKPDRSNLLKTP